MDDESVYSPQLTLSSTPFAASLTDGDKLINTKIDSAQTEGYRSEEELLKGLLADDYCHVCEAVLLFESQRLSHYEGKKHAHKLKLYLQTKRAERKNSDSGGLKRGMPMDKDRFCVLCNMMFSSAVVARSHYEGKVHAKNLRRQGLQPTDISYQPDLPTPPAQTQSSNKADEKAAKQASMEPQDPAASPASKLMDKYCSLCAAPFNNPQMALQHYNGRKHQRNEARQKLLKDLGEDAHQASLTCQMCSIQFNSVEMYQAHMQGNKHQVKEKKVIDLCNSQQKEYNSFADELADYIQVQKARGISPKTSHLLPQGEQEEEEGESEDERGTIQRDSLRHSERMLERLPPPNPPPAPLCGPPHYPAAGWCAPPYQAPPGLQHSFGGTPFSWECPFPHPALFPNTGAPQLPSRPGATQRHSEPSSPSSYSSSSSSYSSDSSHRKHRERRRRKERRPRRERERRAREVDSDEEIWRRRRGKRARHDHCQEGRGSREEDANSESESRSKGHRNQVKKRTRGTGRQEWTDGGEAEEPVAKKAKAEDAVETKEMPTRVQAAFEQTHTAKPPKAKPRRERKKQRKDNRSEEEKLWDVSILGL